MAPSFVVNGQIPVTAEKPSSGQTTSRVASVYSEVQTSRIDHALPLPSVLRNQFSIVNGPPSFAADEIAKLFPSLFGQPSAVLVPVGGGAPDHKLKVGVVLSGGQAPVGHNDWNPKRLYVVVGSYPRKRSDVQQCCSSHWCVLVSGTEPNVISDIKGRPKSLYAVLQTTGNVH